MIREVIQALVFVMGFCLLMSDGDYFPVPSVIGLGILLLLLYI